MHSTVTRAPCSHHHLTTITIATISKLSLLLCRAYRLILSREARYLVAHRLAPPTPSTSSWPISPNSPSSHSMGFQLVTPTWWWAALPPFLLTPNIPRIHNSPSTTCSPHTVSEGAAALAPNHP